MSTKSQHEKMPSRGHIERTRKFLGFVVHRNVVTPGGTPFDNSETLNSKYVSYDVMDIPLSYDVVFAKNNNTIIRTQGGGGAGSDDEKLVGEAINNAQLVGKRLLGLSTIEYNWVPTPRPSK